MREAIKRQAFSESADYLIQVAEQNQHYWSVANMDGLQITSRIGTILAVTANLDAILALAKDNNILSIQ